MFVQLFYASCLNSLEFIKILKFLCVLGGDERCRSSNNNNIYNEGEGGNNNSTYSEGEGKLTPIVKAEEVATTSLAIKVEKK
jgi:hypothetical protein